MAVAAEEVAEEEDDPFLASPVTEEEKVQLRLFLSEAEEKDQELKRALRSLQTDGTIFFEPADVGLQPLPPPPLREDDEAAADDDDSSKQQQKEKAEEDPPASADADCSDL